MRNRQNGDGQYPASTAADEEFHATSADADQESEAEGWLIVRQVVDGRGCEDVLRPSGGTVMDRDGEEGLAGELK